MATKSETDLGLSCHMLSDAVEERTEEITSQNFHELENKLHISSLEDSNESISTNENLSMEGDFKEQNKLEYVSENLDSALDSESNESDTTTSTTDNKLSETIIYQQKIIEQNAETLKKMGEKLNSMEQVNLELSYKLDQVILDSETVF